MWWYPPLLSQGVTYFIQTSLQALFSCFPVRLGSITGPSSDVGDVVDMRENHCFLFPGTQSNSVSLRHCPSILHSRTVVVESDSYFAWSYRRKEGEIKTKFFAS